MSKKIESARITDMPKSIFDSMPQVFATLSGDTEETFVFQYYPDEISFTPSEFIGLTIDEAKSLKGKKDLSYLRS